MMPKWASRRLNQAQAYVIPSIKAIYFQHFLRLQAGRLNGLTICWRFGQSR